MEGLLRNYQNVSNGEMHMIFKITFILGFLTLVSCNHETTDQISGSEQVLRRSSEVKTSDDGDMISPSLEEKLGYNNFEGDIPEIDKIGLNLLRYEINANKDSSNKVFKVVPQRSAKVFQRGFSEMADRYAYGSIFGADLNIQNNTANSFVLKYPNIENANKFHIETISYEDELDLKGDMVLDIEIRLNKISHLNKMKNLEFKLSFINSINGERLDVDKGSFFQNAFGENIVVKNTDEGSTYKGLLRFSSVDLDNFRNTLTQDSYLSIELVEADMQYVDGGIHLYTTVKNSIESKCYLFKYVSDTPMQKYISSDVSFGVLVEKILNLNPFYSDDGALRVIGKDKNNITYPVVRSELLAKDYQNGQWLISGLAPKRNSNFAPGTLQILKYTTLVQAIRADKEHNRRELNLSKENYSLKISKAQYGDRYNFKTKIWSQEKTSENKVGSLDGITQAHSRGDDYFIRWNCKYNYLHPLFRPVSIPSNKFDIEKYVSIYVDGKRIKTTASLLAGYTLHNEFAYFDFEVSEDQHNKNIEIVFANTTTESGNIDLGFTGFWGCSRREANPMESSIHAAHRRRIEPITRNYQYESQIEME